MATIYRSRGVVSQKDAQLIGECLEKLPEATPKAVVAEARKPDSPLHKFFEWDPHKAHKTYLLDRAGQLVRSIEVVITGKQSVKAFHSITVEDEPGEKRRFYAHVDTVAMVDDMREQVLKRALSEVEAWKRRYANYESSLRVIFSAIAEARSGLRKRPASPAERQVV